jgi:hypothetical protein
VSARHDQPKVGKTGYVERRPCRHSCIGPVPDRCGPSMGQHMAAVGTVNNRLILPSSSTQRLIRLPIKGLLRQYRG